MQSLQSPAQQNAANAHRLIEYRAKLTPAQRDRAKVAAKINDYGKKLNLTLKQRGIAIQLASSQLRHGEGGDLAVTVGKDAAWLIAQHSIVKKLTRQRRYPEHLH